MDIIVTRDKLLQIMQSSYMDWMRKYELLDAIIFEQTSDEDSVKVLENIFAFSKVPESYEKAPVTDRVYLSSESRQKVVEEIQEMLNKGHITWDNGFSRLPPSQAARLVFDQLELIGAKTGVAGRIIWLQKLLCPIEPVRSMAGASVYFERIFAQTQYLN
jgi:hypothetical protein